MHVRAGSVIQRIWMEGSAEMEKGSRGQWLDFKNNVCFDAQETAPFAL